MSVRVLVGNEFYIRTFFKKMTATPPPLQLVLGICWRSYPVGVISAITLLSIVLPSHVSVKAKMSTLLCVRKSLKDVVLFLTDLVLSKTNVNAVLWKSSNGFGNLKKVISITSVLVFIHIHDFELKILLNL